VGYNTRDTAIPTRPIADKTVIRASAASATVAARESRAIVLRTTALANAKTALSSADSAMMDQQGLKDGLIAPPPRLRERPCGGLFEDVHRAPAASTRTRSLDHALRPF
jgi:hypothetical protein